MPATQPHTKIGEILASRVHDGHIPMHQAHREAERRTGELRRQIEGRWIGFTRPELLEILARITAGAPASLMTCQLQEEITTALRFRDMHGEPA